MKKEEQWTNGRVIDFVNWYLRLCKVITDKDCRFELENQNVIDSFLIGDDYKLWWNKVNPDLMPDTCCGKYDDIIQNESYYCIESTINDNPVWWSGLIPHLTQNDSDNQLDMWVTDIHKAKKYKMPIDAINDNQRFEINGIITGHIDIEQPLKSAEEILKDGIKDGSYADIIDAINIGINTPNLMAICCFAKDYHAQFVTHPIKDITDEEITEWANNVDIVAELNDPFIKNEDDVSSYDWAVFAAKWMRSKMKGEC